MTEWTDADLAIMQSLDAAGARTEEIARRLGRPASDIERELPIVRARQGSLPIPAVPDNGDGQPWFGPDEEGDVPPARDPTDRAAWVHIDPATDSKRR